MTATRPSDLVVIEDEWAALQFDNAVRFAGTVIENASQETVNAGSKEKPKTVPRYHMDELLDPDFKLPAPKTKVQRNKEGLAALVGMVSAGKGGRVKHTEVK